MIVVKINPATNAVLRIENSAEASASSDTLVFHDQNSTEATLDALSLLSLTVPLRYLKHSNGSIIEMSANEKTAVDAEIEHAESWAARQTNINSFQISEDFSSGSSLDGAIGTLGFGYSGGICLSISSELGRPGIIRRSTGTTADTDCITFLNSTNLTSIFSSDYFDMLWIVRVPQVDANTTVRIGAGGIDSFPPPSGIYFERLSTDGSNLFAVCRSSKLETRASVGELSSSFLKFRIRRKSADVIGFSLDNGAEVNISTNVPAIAMNPFTYIKNVGTTVTKNLDHDYFDLLIKGISR